MVRIGFASRFRLILGTVMEETAKRFSPICDRQELIWNSWRLTCNLRSPSPSMTRGKTSRPRESSRSTLPKIEALARLGAGDSDEPQMTEFAHVVAFDRRTYAALA